MTVRELAVLLQAEFTGLSEQRITGAASLESAGAGDLSFVSGPKTFASGQTSRAGCLIAPATYPAAADQTVIFADVPRTLFARALRILYPEAAAPAGIHSSAVVHSTASIGENVSIAAHVSIEGNTVVGAGTHIGAGCAVGREVIIGQNCRIRPNVTIYDGVRLGDRVTLHAGCVIGADGFGFVLEGSSYAKFPQVGGVEIGDDVEIGANSCVDRAALGTTRIGDGTKIDNLVHVGHNCSIGRHVVVAAQTGFSGGVTVGDHAVIGGQVGIGDKARIESGAVLGSGCGVLTSKIVRSGQVMWGTPARPLREHLEQLASLARLPKMREELRQLRRELEALEKAKCS